MDNTPCFKNLKFLWWLRNIAICGQTIAIFVVTNALHIPLVQKPLWIILGIMAVVNIATFFRINSARTISEFEFICQLLIDIAALFGLLHFTGGATNPFASIFILQVIIAAITLSPLYTGFIAALTIVLYTVLMVWKVEVPYFMHHHIDDFFSLHVQGMWISFMLLASVGAWFVVRINSTIKRQDFLLADATKMAAIGTLAASAAHELGTPLATISVLAEDYATEESPLERQRKAKLLANEIARCKNILSGITAAGGVTRAEGGSSISLESFINDVITSWQVKLPQIALQIEHDGKIPDINIIADNSLTQAIHNLLDNAADASPDYVAIKFAYTIGALKLIIEDKGAGISDKNAGQPGHTTKPNGMGMGLFLSKSIITRMGGSFEVESSGRGTCIIIKLPLKEITVL